MRKILCCLFVLASTCCSANGLVRGNINKTFQNETGIRETKTYPLKYADIENFKVKQDRITYNRKTGLVEKQKYTFIPNWFRFMFIKKNRGTIINTPTKTIIINPR